MQSLRHILLNAFIMSYHVISVSGETLSVRRAHVLSHLHQLEGETLVEDAIDSGSSRQLIRVYLISRALDTLLEIHRELLHHPETNNIYTEHSSSVLLPYGTKLYGNILQNIII